MKKNLSTSLAVIILTTIQPTVAQISPAAKQKMAKAKKENAPKLKGSTANFRKASSKAENYLGKIRTSMGLMVDDRTPVYSTVVLDITKIQDIPGWERKLDDNTNLINKQLRYKATDKYYFINLLSITNDPDNKFKAAWLKNNRAYIDIPMTGFYAQNSHLIDHLEQSDDMLRKAEADYGNHVITFGNLKTKINTWTVDYNNDIYDNYVSFDIADPAVLGVTPVKDYVDNKHLFSICMLKGIYETYNLTDANSLAIGTTTVGSNTFTYLWIVGTHLFYNFSNEPR